MLDSGVDATTACVPTAVCFMGSSYPLLIAVHFLLLQMLSSQWVEINSDSHHSSCHQSPFGLFVSLPYIHSPSIVPTKVFFYKHSLHTYGATQVTEQGSRNQHFPFLVHISYLGKNLSCIIAALLSQICACRVKGPALCGYWVGAAERTCHHSRSLSATCQWWHHRSPDQLIFPKLALLCVLLCALLICT